MAKATKVKIDLQTGTDRTLYATWTWSTKNTSEYSVKWYYGTGDGVWFIGSESTVTAKQCTYSAPENALRVKFLVKPIAKTHTVNKKSVAYWTASWSTAVYYSFVKETLPEVPSVPTVTIDNYQLTAEVDTYDEYTQLIEFRIIQDDSGLYSIGGCYVSTNHAAYTVSIVAGHRYKVQCRGFRENSKGVPLYSDWSEYSSNTGTIPDSVSGITSCKAASSTSVRVEWAAVGQATEYEVEYTTKLEYFDASSETSSMTVTTTYAVITGLTSGEEYFFRVRATNDQGESGWCTPQSTIVGKAPSAPTTWSSTTTATVGQSVVLYWVHNSEDNSSQTYAELEITANGTATTYTIQNTTDDTKDQTSSYTLSTSSYTEGTTILWRVRTKGILDEYGDWSTQRKISVYAPPTISLSVPSSVTGFPFTIAATVGPKVSDAVGYSVTITAQSSYQTTDSKGNEVWVTSGQEVYSSYIDANGSHLSMSVSASDVMLENNASYRVQVLVSMSTGLSTAATANFAVSWSDEEYEPNAEISIDEDTLSAYIGPYCEDASGNLVSGVTLAVYRKEFDGKFVALATGLTNERGHYINDPHPALDYARYRITATSTSTGKVSFYDLPAYPVGGTEIVIQWDEAWSNFDDGSEDALEDPVWAGSMLKLPYDVDVSDNYKPDVTLAEYIGRENPVGYYGTQIGQTSSLKTNVIYNDEETLYGLRRLARYMGNVYMREPSGSGYWAQVNVSFSQTHCELLIPVTLEITRVEGGV